MNAGRRGGVARGRAWQARRAVAVSAAAGAAALWPVVPVQPALADSSPQVTRVSMKEFAFNPATVTVQAGSAVEWTYDESATDPMPNCESPYFQSPSPVQCGGHSTTASENGPDGKPLWDSGVHRADGFPFTHIFAKPGTYHYYCILHGGPHPNQPVTHMEGDIVVVAASSSGGGGGSVSNAAGSGGAGGSAPGARGAAPSTGGGLQALPNTAGTGSDTGLAGAGVFMLALVRVCGRLRGRQP
jgi:plastocyanin